MPDAVLMLFDTIVIFDHLHSVIKVCSNIFLSSEPTSEEIAQKYESAQLEIKKVEDLLNVNETVFPTQDFSLEDEESVANFGENEYKGFVESVKEKILVGEVFQTVPSRRIKRKTNLNPFNAYRRLRTVNPSPYMFYLDLKDFHLVGASPEMLVKVQERKVFMHPIAGTRKRGSTPEKDDAMANELIMDLKERSEHVMLVDLGRNDVNRVCDPKTVKVDSLMHIERYAHVMHIVSNVSGILRKDKTPYDAFRSIFPAGLV
jgi:anthranilate synthase component 1